MAFTKNVQLIVERATTGGYLVKIFNGINAGDALFASDDLNAVLRFVSEVMRSPSQYMIEG
ncbi:hypothetical protein [Methylobacterium sp. J-070]|uniref:hypothetical protein n=1 Tax=Methylobacterium sp. J-070 TaxID=2836650 RepID=UPI001FBA93B1|nr:hypothetical protein [Methylobacterium sp. J-070]MCJ2053886.1 hypothetical protein [Methylobacterium sp. J-070]